MVLECNSRYQFLHISVPNQGVGFPCGSAGKESTCNDGDLGSIPELGRSPGEGKGYPLRLAWRIPWTIQSMGLQKVGHKWATFAFTSFKKAHILYSSFVRSTLLSDPQYLIELSVLAAILSSPQWACELYKVQHYVLFTFVFLATFPDCIICSNAIVCIAIDCSY